MEQNYSKLTKDEIEEIATKILDELNIGDFITDIGDGIYKIDSGGGVICYTNKIGAYRMKSALTDFIKNNCNDTTDKTN